VKGAYLVVLDGLHPDADSAEVGRRLEAALAQALSPLTVRVSQQWVLPADAERQV
jgi:hypothetical protein